MTPSPPRADPRAAPGAAAPEDAGAAGPSAPRDRRNAWLLAVLWLVYAVNFIDRNILAVLLQPIKEELQVSDTAMGVLVGFAFAAFYTFAGIPIARLADRYDRRGVMAVGVAFWSLMTAASGLARSYAQLAVARIGVGVGEASATPAAHSMIADAFPPERRTSALAIYNTGAGAGVLFGLLLGGYLQEWFGWRVAFAVVGLPGLAIALLVRFTLPEPVRGASEGRADEAAPGFLETFRHLAAIPSFRHVALSAGLYGMTAYGLTLWAVTLMIRVHEQSYAVVGRNLGLVIGIAGSIGAIAGAALCDRLVKRDVRALVWIPALATLAMGPFYALFVLAEDPTLALVAFVPVNLLNVVFPAPVYAITQGLARLRMRATAAAIVLFVLNLIGLGLGPTLVGICNDWLEPRHGVQAIRLSLLILLGFSFWGAVHSALAARTLEADLSRAQAQGGR